MAYPSSPFIRPWLYRGRIVSGRGLGRKIGAPTFNIPLRDKKIPHGIFAGLVVVGDHAYPAVIHAGPRPAVGDMTPIVEAHLLRGIPKQPPRSIIVMGLHRLRSIKPFRTRIALIKAITQDIQKARHSLGIPAI